MVSPKVINSLGRHPPPIAHPPMTGLPTSQLMTDTTVQRDVICCSAMISACEKVAFWRWALHFLAVMVEDITGHHGDTRKGYLERLSFSFPVIVWWRGRMTQVW